MRERRSVDNRRHGLPRRREDRVARTLNLVRGWAAVAFIGLAFWLLHDQQQQTDHLATKADHAAHTSIGAVTAAAAAAQAAQRGLHYFVLLSAQRRQELRRDDARNRRLALRIGELSVQRTTDNARQLAVLSAQQARVATLQVAQRAATSRTEYDICVRVEAVKRAVRLNFRIVFPHPERLRPDQRALVLRLERGFIAIRCVPPRG